MVVLLTGVLLLLAAAWLVLTYVGRAPERPPLQRTNDVSAIAGWMTIPYISRAYDVPEDRLLTAVHISAAEAHHSSLQTIAREQQRPLADIESTVRSTIVAYRRENPPTPPASAGRPRASHLAGSS